MSVTNRLQRLTGETQSRVGADRPNNGSRAEEIGALRERIEAVFARRSVENPSGEMARGLRGRGVPLDDLVPGAETVTEAGAFFCSRRVAGGSSRHGSRCIRDLAPLDMGLLAVLGNDQALRKLDYGDALFLDTETTGLAGGTGTVAFLIGLGWFEGEAFVTQQLFMRDYAEERAALLYLRDLLRGRKFLVTFNGKAFDANLLAARFIMNRLPDPLGGLPHLDLLHPARRLLSHRLADRRLSALEAAILGFDREGDIPGSEIPQRYFDWLRRRDGLLMADVFEHNRLDIMSLAALAAHLVALIDPGGDSEGEVSRRHPGDSLAAARLFLARDCPDDAIRLLHPLGGCGCTETAREAGRELSFLYKRAGRWQEAVKIWEEMAEKDAEDMFALIELAKWHEHRRRDSVRALELTTRACACNKGLTPEERRRLVRRRERLERKLTRHP